MKERRLSGAGRRDQRDRLAGQEVERWAVQALDRGVGAPVSTLARIEAQRRAPRLIIHNAAPRPDRAWPRARTDRSSPRATRSALSRRRKERPSFRRARAIATGNRIRKERDWRR